MDFSHITCPYRRNEMMRKCAEASAAHASAQREAQAQSRVTVPFH